MKSAMAVVARRLHGAVSFETHTFASRGSCAVEVEGVGTRAGAGVGGSGVLVLLLLLEPKPDWREAAPATFTIAIAILARGTPCGISPGCAGC